jgi:hypothetical protein
MRMIRSTRALIPILCGVLGLAACEKNIEPPFARGVCFHAVPLKNGQIRFNQLSVNQPDIEHCGASLEAMREQFLGLGGGSENIMGAYQGSYIFLESRGIFVSQSLHGTRYLALVRTGDGNLSTPGAAPLLQQQ